MPHWRLLYGMTMGLSESVPSLANGHSNGWAVWPGQLSTHGGHLVC